MVAPRWKPSLLFLATIFLTFALIANAEEAPNAPTPDPRLKTLAELQTKVVSAFVKAFGNGYERMLRPASTPFDKDMFTVLIEGERWNVDRLNLVGLVFHQGKPTVFENPRMPFVDPDVYKEVLASLHNATHDSPAKPAFVNKIPDIGASIPAPHITSPVRAPDEFESESLKKLNQGEQMVASFDNDEIRLVGAIRVGKSCLNCHQDRETLSSSESGKDIVIKQPLKKDDLIGAFTYRLKRAAKDTNDTKVVENH